ncbi:MAG: hypothetical protein CML06_07390 [Pseudomonadales bacterium]|nr:hypothetical protein [Pseudomonadales bacterium]
MVQAPAVCAANPVHLEASAQKVSEGFISLNWNEFSGQAPIRLQVSERSQWTRPLRELSLTGQTRVHLSGFPDGTFNARLVDAGGQVLSNTVQFRVQHRDLGLAGALFALGALLFLALVVTLIRFSATSQQQ